MESILNTFGVDWRLLLIQMINFAVLLAILWHFLYRPTMRMITERQQIIQKGVQDASLAERKLKDAEIARDTLLSSAHTEAEQTLKQARERAKVSEERLTHEALQKGEALLEEARMKAEEFKQGALRESQQEIARCAVLAAEKMLRSSSRPLPADSFSSREAETV